MSSVDICKASAQCELAHGASEMKSTGMSAGSKDRTHGLAPVNMHFSSSLHQWCLCWCCPAHTLTCRRYMTTGSHVMISTAE